MATKTAAKKSPKKGGKKSKAKKPLKQPPAQMMQDVQDVLEKHGWSGSMIVKPATASLAATAAAAAGGGPCPPGKTPQEISFQLSDGTWVSRIICV